MGRKIPGKKHRGVKDPYQQHANRQALVKNKVNRAPTNPDDQPVPKSLMSLMKVKDGGVSKKEHKEKVKVRKEKVKLLKKKALSTIVYKESPLNKLQKMKGETKKGFNMRINEALKNIKRDGDDNISYRDIEEKVPEKKERRVENENRPEYIQKGGKRKKKPTDEPKLSKNQKKIMIEKSKKDKIKDKKEFEEKCMIKTDFVKFGEVVHEPPTLNVKPRKAEGYETVSRPARKDLLLNSLFENSNQSSKGSNQKRLPNIKLNVKRIQGPVDLKGKRKILPTDIRKRLEESQQEAIQAYKLLKMQYKNSNKVSTEQ